MGSYRYHFQNLNVFFFLFIYFINKFSKTPRDQTLVLSPSTQVMSRGFDF